MRRDFPRDDYATVMTILNGYGRESWHRERARVQLAVLKVANASVEKLRTCIELAKRDYRDALAVAEYPAYFEMATVRPCDSCSVSASSVHWRLCTRQPHSYNLLVTKEHWAQIGITTQFLIVVRTLGEIFRLKYVHAASFSAAIAMPYVGGALIAGCCCWVGVTLYFFRRYAMCAWTALGTVVILLAYKITVLGW